MNTADVFSVELGCKMNFGIYLPPKAESVKVPVIYWLSGKISSVALLLAVKTMSSFLDCFFWLNVVDDGLCIIFHITDYDNVIALIVQTSL